MAAAARRWSLRMRPSSMASTRSACATRRWSWLTHNTVVPWAMAIRCRRSMIIWPLAASRALVGSSANRSCGSLASALDAGNGQIVIDTLHRIARTHGATVLCVSHDQRLIAYADRVLAMEDGKILSDRRPYGAATTKEVLR